MSWPEGIEARPIEKGDADAWAELLSAKEKVDQEGENYSAQDLIDELEDPHIDPALDTIGLWAAGRMVAFGKVYAADSVVDVDRVRTEGTVHPEWRRRGLGTALMPWLIRRACELHLEKHPDATGEVSNSAISTNVGADRLLQKFGFEQRRYFFDMKRPVDQPVPEVALTDRGPGAAPRPGGDCPVLPRSRARPGSSGEGRGRGGSSRIPADGAWCGRR